MVNQLAIDALYDVRVHAVFHSPGAAVADDLGLAFGRAHISLGLLEAGDRFDILGAPPQGRDNLMVNCINRGADIFNAAAFCGWFHCYLP